MMRLITLSLFMVLFFQSLPQAQATKKPTLAEFKKSIENHVQRLPIYAKIIFLEQNSHFKSLAALPRQKALRLISIRLGLHDFPKTMSLEELRSLGYQNDRSFLEKLFEIWGQQVRPDFINDLNELEHRVIAEQMKDLLTSWNVDPTLHARIMEDLDLLELVSDVIDTKWHRGKELGFNYKLFDAAENLKNRKYLEAADLARWYESKYYPDKKMLFNMCRSLFEG